MPQKWTPNRSSGVTAALVVSLLVVAALTGAAPDQTESASEGEGVEWVISSSDTLRDVIDNATSDQSNADVAAAIELIAESDPSALPGLDKLDPAELSETVNAVKNSDPLPDFLEEVPVAVDTGGPVAPAGARISSRSRSIVLASSRHVLPAGAINGNGSWEQTNWIRRGVTTIGGVNWTDRVDLRWVTDPGAASSKVSYTVKYFPNSGFFSGIRLQTRAFNGSSVQGSTGWFGSVVGSTTRYVYNSASLRGKSLWHQTELAANQRSGGTASDQQRTGTAQCRPNDNVCRY